MIEESSTIEERIERLLDGTETAEDRQEIAAYVRDRENRVGYLIEFLCADRDRFLKKAATLGDAESKLYLKEREIDEKAAAREDYAERLSWYDEESDGE